MNGQDLPFLNGVPVRLVVPGYYGTYWVKHLSEITVHRRRVRRLLDETPTAFPTTTATAPQPGTPPKTTIPIGRFTVRSFITSVADGAQGSPPAQQIDLHGHRLRRRHRTSRTVDVSTDDGKSWTRGQARPGSGKYSLRANGSCRSTLAAGLLRAHGARPTATAARRSRSTPLLEPAGYGANVDRNASRVTASLRRLTMTRPSSSSPWRRPRRPRPSACWPDRAVNAKPVTYVLSRRNRCLQAARTPISKTVQGQLRGLPLGGLHRHPAAGRRPSRRPSGSRGRPDDQGLRHATDRRRPSAPKILDYLSRAVPTAPPRPRRDNPVLK